MSFNITPVASGYQEIHPYSAMNIDSVKIKTSLVMLRECLIMFSISISTMCVIIASEFYVSNKGRERMVCGWVGKWRKKLDEQGAHPHTLPGGHLPKGLCWQKTDDTSISSLFTAHTCLSRPASSTRICPIFRRLLGTIVEDCATIRSPSPSPLTTWWIFSHTNQSKANVVGRSALIHTQIASAWS